MNVSAINHSFTQHKPSFKSNITFDIGGSQREGSCKIYYATSEKDDVIYTTKTTVNTLGKTRFENSADFKNQIVKKVKKVQANNVNNISDMGYPEEENTIKSMTIFIPSYTSGAFAYYLPNHKNNDDRPLKDLDFSDMKELLIANGVKVSPDMRFMLLQDAMGTGLAVAQKLYNRGMLTKGKYYTTAITGGGCGITNIKMTSDDKVIIESSGSGYLSESMTLQKVSKVGASAPALIRNFCKSFGLNEEMQEDIQSCHKAEFVLNNPVEFKKDIATEKLKKLLLDTDKYEVLAENEKSYVISVKKDYEEMYKRSQRNAIDKYCLAFARLAIIKKNEGSNGLIITGPLARAVNRTAKENYQIGISDWVTGHLLGSFNTYELEKMQKTYNFQVFCDDRFALNDNTACKKLAHEAEFISPERGNWLEISTKYLKEQPESY